MKLYLIRHGETAVNAGGKIHQSPETPLSELGKQQAEQLGKYLTKFHFDNFYTSPLIRARQTAYIVQRNIGISFIELACLKERQNPSILFGKKYDDPNIMRIKKLISDNYSNPNFRYSDEETFFDLKDRILKIFNYFKNSKDKDILVISHGHIMAFIIGMMMTKNKLRPSEYQKIDKEVNLNNASVTIASEDGPDRWSFPIFNYHGFLKKHTGIMGLENNKKQNLKRINLV